MFRRLAVDLDVDAVGEACVWSAFSSSVSAVLHYCEPDCTVSVRQSTSGRSLPDLAVRRETLQS